MQEQMCRQRNEGRLLVTSQTYVMPAGALELNVFIDYFCDSLVKLVHKGGTTKYIDKFLQILVWKLCKLANK